LQRRVYLRKRALVKQVADRVGVTEDVASKTMDAITDVITESLVKDMPVQLIKLGTFEKTHVNERKARNPVDGTISILPAKNRVRFTPNKTLKDAIN